MAEILRMVSGHHRLVGGDEQGTVTPSDEHGQSIFICFAWQPLQAFRNSPISRLNSSSHSPASSQDCLAYALAFAGPMQDGVRPGPDTAPRPQNPSRERDD